MRGEGGYIWQQSFYDRVIQSDVQLSNEINYMHYNPVRAGLVDSPRDYEFSSHRYYFGEAYRNLIDRIA
jgi:putative transposase